MTTFEALLAAVVAHLEGAFPAVPTVQLYPRLRQKITSPALLVELADADGAADPGTGELAVTARLELRAVVDRAPTAPGQSPDLAALGLATSAALAVYAAGRFGLAVGPAQHLRIEPDHFKPELATYAVWLVTWTHEVRLGADLWTGEGIIPTEVWAGLSPEIGLPHQDDYLEVTRP